MDSHGARNELPDDHALLARVRALDEEALAQVHDHYYEPIYRYIIYRVGHQQAAEDLASEVFLRLLSALQDKSAPRKTLRGWLYGVASHVVNDYHRKQYRSRSVPLDENIVSRQPDPDEAVAGRLDWQRVYVLLETLTAAQREVIALRFGHGLPIKEVARLLDKSEGAVKQLQARAVTALAQRVTEDNYSG